MRSLFMFILALVVIALAAFGVWQLLPKGESVPDLGPFMQPILEWTADEAVDAVPRQGVPDQLLVLPFPGDVRERGQAAVVAAIEDRGLSRVVDREAFKEKAAAEKDWATLFKDILGLEPKLPDKAQEFLQRHALPGVLMGEATIAETDAEGGVTLRLRIYDTLGKLMHGGEAKRVYAKSLSSWPYLRSRILTISLAWRLLGWLLFLLLLPLVLSPILTRRLKRESNATNGVTLVTLTLVSAIVLWGGLAFSTGFWSAFCVAVLGLGVGGVYHFLIVDFLEDLRK